MEVWAHRGRTSPTELGNSSKNFISCYSLGVTGIETDVSLTADGRMIIYHPGSTYPNLTKMNWHDIDWSIFDVMTLSQFLNSLRAYKKLSCCLEIKSDSKKLIEQIVGDIEYRGLEERVFITAFQKKINLPFISTESDGESLLYAKKLNNKIKTHLIANWPSNLPKIAEQYSPDMISFGWLQEPRAVRLISGSIFTILVKTRNFREDIKKVKAMGIKVIGGIVNDARSMDYLIDLGVDGIMTDNPTLAMTPKEER